MWPARSSASIDICLPGLASSVKAGRGHPLGALGDDDEQDHRAIRLMNRSISDQEKSVYCQWTVV
jgi:hypothetical protein